MALAEEVPWGGGIPAALRRLRLVGADLDLTGPVLRGPDKQACAAWRAGAGAAAPSCLGLAGHFDLTRPFHTGPGIRFATRYLLATGVVSSVIQPAPSAWLLAWMIGQSDDGFISVATVAGA